MTPDEQIELEQLALEEAKLAEQAAAIAERRETIKHLLRDRLPLGTHRLGGCTVQVRAGSRRLDSGLLMREYPVARFPELYRPIIDVTQVRDRFSPRDLEPFQVVSPSTVVVK